MASQGVETSIDWIGLNPDPARYRFDLLEKKKRQSATLRIYPFTSKGDMSIQTRESNEINRGATNSEYGKWLGRFAPKHKLTYIEISGPSARGTIEREIYRTNIVSSSP